MTLQPTQLLALLRVSQDVGGADTIEELVVDGQVVRDVPATLQVARKTWDEILAEVHGDDPGDVAARAAKKHGWWSRVTGRVEGWVERAVERADAPRAGKKDPVGWFLSRTLKPLATETPPVVRQSVVEVRLRGGQSFQVSADVIDLPATHTVRKTDLVMSGASTVPVPIPIAGAAYGIVTPAISALAAANKAGDAREAGDHASAKAYDSVRTRQWAIAWNAVIPFWSTVTSLFAAATAGRHLRALRNFTTVESVVSLGERQPVVAATGGSPDIKSSSASRPTAPLR